jgi:hypothetical protein
VRIDVVAFVFACSACLHTSVDTDGKWTSLDAPCVPVGPVRKLLDTRFSVISIPAGDSILYSGGQTVSQLDLATGESRVVLRSDGVSQFATIGDDLVYYEGDGSSNGSSPINLIVDHGARSTSRYERISPRPNRVHAGLLATPAGVYWWTSYDGDPANAEYWRWDPETGIVDTYALAARSIVRTDEDSFFYADARNRLIVRPQRPGEFDLVIEKDPDGAAPQPIGIDGDELFYVNHTMPSYFDGDLVTRGADGEERVIASGRYITGGAIDPTYVYFTEDCGFEDGGPFQTRCQNLYRVPRAGGPIETVFEGEPNSVVFDVVVDTCNVYWQHFTMDGGYLYGSEITR